jgi:antitoxin component of MazEF toxin-antitoxin module
MIVPLPPILLEQLGWKEGDDITFSIDDKGHVILSKKSK